MKPTLPTLIVLVHYGFPHKETLSQYGATQMAWVAHKIKAILPLIKKPTIVTVSSRSNIAMESANCLQEYIGNSMSHNNHDLFLADENPELEKFNAVLADVATAKNFSVAIFVLDKSAIEAAQNFFTKKYGIESQYTDKISHGDSIFLFPEEGESRLLYNPVPEPEVVVTHHRWGDETK